MYNPLLVNKMVVQPTKYPLFIIFRLKCLLRDLLPSLHRPQDFPIQILAMITEQE
jgi:hypothetical protein